jgi:hypothetical protein
MQDCCKQPKNIRDLSYMDSQSQKPRDIVSILHKSTLLMPTHMMEYHETSKMQMDDDQCFMLSQC